MGKPGSKLGVSPPGMSGSKMEISPSPSGMSISKMGVSLSGRLGSNIGVSPPGKLGDKMGKPGSKLEVLPPGRLGNKMGVSSSGKSGSKIGVTPSGNLMVAGNIKLTSPSRESVIKESKNKHGGEHSRSLTMSHSKQEFEKLHEKWERHHGSKKPSETRSGIIGSFSGVQSRSKKSDLNANDKSNEEYYRGLTKITIKNPSHISGSSVSRSSNLQSERSGEASVRDGSISKISPPGRLGNKMGVSSSGMSGSRIGVTPSGMSGSKMGVSPSGMSGSKMEISSSPSGMSISKMGVSLSGRLGSNIKLTSPSRESARKDSKNKHGDEHSRSLTMSHSKQEFEELYDKWERHHGSKKPSETRSGIIGSFSGVQSPSKKSDLNVKNSSHISGSSVSRSSNLGSERSGEASVRDDKDDKKSKQEIEKKSEKGDKSVRDDYDNKKPKQETEKKSEKPKQETEKKSE